MTTSGTGSGPSRKRPGRKEAPSTLDLHALLGQGKVRVESQPSRAEIRARLANEEARLKLEIWRDKAVIRLSIVAFSILGVACLVLIFFPGVPPEVRTWACAIITSMASGVICYSLGKSGKGP